jgi:arylsulfatase A-like enzyme
VSIAPYRAISPAAFGPGFLGPRYAPLIVGERAYGAGRAGSRAFRVDDLELPAEITRDRADDRLGLMQSLSRDFQETRPGVTPVSHKDAYLRAVKMMRSPAAKAFELDGEPASIRDAYGRNPFGQGCLLARRLVEHGVPFVEVTLSSVDGRNSIGWDTHSQNFEAVKGLCGVLDAGWSTLISDLRSRGLLDNTLIVWMGEFGRTPKINENAGRDHFPNAWSTVLAGGKLKGGRVIGDTGADGVEVRDRPVSVPDFLATIVKGLGLDPMGQNTAEDGRPIRLVDIKAKPIVEVLG